MLFSIHNEQEITRRQAIFDNINQSREYKGRLLDQLKIMDWQKAGFLQRVKEMKAEREGLKKDFYGQHHNYEREILKFNFEFFKETIADQEKINEYYQLGERLRQKRMNRQDSTEELTMIKKLDQEARELSLRKVSEVQTNEYISFQTVREEPKYDNNQGRGIRM
jgi:glycosylphosphatidylinositol transamidase (GPIT) subunit GPI8